MTADPAISTEHQLLRDAWAELDAERFKQTEVRAKMKKLEGRLGKQRVEAISASYLSQVLVKSDKTEGDKQPSTFTLQSVALALDALVDDHRARIDPKRVLKVTGSLNAALAGLRVTRPIWQDGEAPLEAGAMNAVRRQADEDIDGYLRQYNRNFLLTVTGGPKAGKTSLLFRTRARARSLGYRVLFADVGDLFVRCEGDEAKYWTDLGVTLGLPGTVVDGSTFQVALRKVLAAEDSRVLLLLDGANVLADQAGAPAAVDWADLALGHLTRFLAQQWRQALPESEWKRLCVIAAMSFSVDLLPVPTQHSTRLIQDRSLNVAPLDGEEIRALVGLHVLHAQLDLGLDIDPTDEQVGALVTELDAWFAGQPMLVQEAIGRWVLGPHVDPAELVRAYTDVAKRYIRHLVTQVAPIPGEVVRDDNGTLLVDPSTGEGSRYRMREDAAELLGLVDFGAWRGRYLVEWLAPRLPKA